MFFDLRGFSKSFLGLQCMKKVVAVVTMSMPAAAMEDGVPNGCVFKIGFDPPTSGGLRNPGGDDDDDDDDDADDDADDEVRNAINN